MKATRWTRVLEYCEVLECCDERGGGRSGVQTGARVTRTVVAVLKWAARAMAAEGKGQASGREGVQKRRRPWHLTRLPPTVQLRDRRGGCLTRPNRASTRVDEACAVAVSSPPCLSSSARMGSPECGARGCCGVVQLRLLSAAQALLRHLPSSQSSAGKSASPHAWEWSKAAVGSRSRPCPQRLPSRTNQHRRRLS